MKYVGKVHSEYVRGILVEDYDRTITRVNDDGTTKQLDLRLDLANHSPTGFCWGYQGSGPAQAALAILADMFDDNFARLNYQILKRELIAGLPMDEDFVINDRQIRNALVSDMIESISPDNCNCLGVPFNVNGACKIHGDTQ